MRQLRLVVIGGSIAGLITGRVLSDHFGQVTVLERDEIEDRPVLHKSVPQGNHLHALLNGSQQVLSAHYPGFTDDLRRRGANRVAVGRDVVWHLPDGKAYTASGSVRAPLTLAWKGIVRAGFDRIRDPAANSGSSTDPGRLEEQSVS